MIVTQRCSIAVLMMLTVASAPVWAAGDAGPAGDPEIAGPAWGADGAWRTRIQQVFDPATRTLTRRSYTVWDPEPARDLDFVWQPDDPATDKPGRIDGRGHLVWRMKGLPSYDPAGVVAAYRGTIRAGVIAGRGSYLERTGLSYDGDWTAGRMHGMGTLKLATGDEYTGAFRDGRAHGRGRYTDVTGEVFEGTFVAGQRHGRGTTTLPNGHRYVSTWTAGKEAAGSRLVRLAQVPGSGPAAGRDDLRLGITVDRQLPKPATGEDVRPETGDLWYSVSNTASGLAIQPDNKRLMSMWKGGGNIALTRLEEHAAEYGVLSLSRAQIVPLNLNLQVQNRSASRIDIAGLYLDVANSVTDLQPAIQMAVGAFGGCTEGLNFISRAKLENFGWGAAEGVAARFDFVRPSGGTGSGALSKNIGNISRTATFDFEGDLRSLGVDTEFFKRLPKKGIECQRPKTTAACLQALKASGRLGRLADMVAVDTESDSGGHVIIGVAGRLDYAWRDVRGGPKRNSAPFRTVVPLAFLRQDVECGEGGGREIVASKAQTLRLDAANYRIAISYRGSVPAGRTSQLVLPIRADKASRHVFSLVVQLADGREIRSRPVDLTYFVPSWHPRSGS